MDLLLVIILTFIIALALVPLWYICHLVRKISVQLNIAEEDID